MLLVGLSAPSATAVSSVVLSSERNPIDVTREALAQAETSVDAVVYKFTTKRLEDSVLAALARGVAVRLVADEEEAKRKQSRIKRIARAGASVRVWERSKLHAKFTVIDGRVAIAGSFNWTESAESENLELLVWIDEPGDVARLTEIFGRLWEGAEPWDD